MPGPFRSRLLLAALCSAGLAAPFAGCGSSGSSSSSTPSSSPSASPEGGSTKPIDLKLGIVAGATGALASGGQAFIANAKLGAQTLNEQLQKARLSNKYKVTITGTNDTHGQPQAAIAACKKAVDGDGSQGIIGDFFSSTTIACAQSVTIPAGIPVFSGGTSPALTQIDQDHLIWRLESSDAYGAQVAAQYAAKKFGPGATINIGYEDDAFGRPYAKLVFDALTERGLGVGNSVALTPGAASFATEASKLTSNKPAGWFFIIFCEEWGKLRPQLERSVAWSPQKTLIEGGATECPPPAALNKGISGVERDLDGGQGYDAYARAYETASNPPNETWTTPTFDAVYVAFLAAVAAKSDDPAKWKDQVKSVSGPNGEPFDWQQLPEAIKALEGGKQIAYQGVSGNWEYNDSGEPTTAMFSIWVANGNGSRRQISTIVPDAKVQVAGG